MQIRLKWSYDLGEGVGNFCKETMEGTRWRRHRRNMGKKQMKLHGIKRNLHPFRCGAGGTRGNGAKEAMCLLWAVWTCHGSKGKGKEWKKLFIFWSKKSPFFAENFGVSQALEGFWSNVAFLLRTLHFYSIITTVTPQQLGQGLARQTSWRWRWRSQIIFGQGGETQTCPLKKIFSVLLPWKKGFWPFTKIQSAFFEAFACIWNYQVLCCANPSGPAPAHSISRPGSLERCTVLDVILNTEPRMAYASPGADFYFGIHLSWVWVGWNWTTAQRMSAEKNALLATLE